LKIAVIDNEKGILLSISIFLEMEKHEVYTFNLPLEAIKCIPELSIDIIILDLYMPEINGDDIVKIFRSNHKTKDIPIILFSAHDNIFKIAKGLEVQGIIKKPFIFKELIELINKILINDKSN